MNKIIELAKQFSDRCSDMEFSPDLFVYNPAEYAWENYEQYLSMYVKPKTQVFFLGMNPGPFGMMQTGVPFGEINTVKNYLKINNKVGKPKKEHPNRPILGMAESRSEISGLRFWTLIKKHYPNADFFQKLCVMNFCPLGFVSSAWSAKNIALSNISKQEREKLENLCLSYLSEFLSIVRPFFLIGVGKYAEEKLLKVSDSKTRVLRIIHPSPANPQANINWLEKTDSYLKEFCVW